jgi:hypothetical protein
VQYLLTLITIALGTCESAFDGALLRRPCASASELSNRAEVR